MARRTNSSMGAAKAAKKDEFYTQLEDIEAEMRHYWEADWRTREGARNPFAGKTVLLNCDDPLTSNFWFYFAANFDHLGIKELISTHYEADGSQSYAMFLDREENGDRIDYGTGEDNTPLGRVENLAGNGDFRDPECVELLKRSDIVVTNPPFSLFREYVAQLVEYDKKFIVVGNMNAITYKEVFP